MAQLDTQEFKFPDEVDDKDQGKPEDLSAGGEIEIEIEDDTPTEDRGKTPMPKPLVEELDKDELDKYDDAVKEKLKQMRKVWHDERREKEAALREQQEAIHLAQRLMQENQHIKNILTKGEKEFVSTAKSAAKAELSIAKAAYKAAYDSGDADQIIKAQQAMNEAQYKLENIKKFKLPTLQQENFQVQQQPVQQPQQQVRVDPKAEAWQERNPWFGQNKGMTAYALGLHEELRENGVTVGSDEYYTQLDKTMRKRFPDAFDAEEEQPSREPARPKASTVVAPATRSTSPQKVKLKQSQLNLIRKLGITPEQYVKEFVKEARNG